MSPARRLTTKPAKPLMRLSELERLAGRAERRLEALEDAAKTLQPAVAALNRQMGELRELLVELVRRQPAERFDDEEAA